MKTGVGAAGGKTSVGEIARSQKRGDARDVPLKSQCRQVELKLDMFIKSFRHARGNFHRRRGSRRLRGNIEPPLNLTNILRILVEPGAIAWANVLLKAS